MLKQKFPNNSRRCGVRKPPIYPYIEEARIILMTYVRLTLPLLERIILEKRATRFAGSEAMTVLYKVHVQELCSRNVITLHNLTLLKLLRIVIILNGGVETIG